MNTAPNRLSIDDCKKIAEGKAMPNSYVLAFQQLADTMSENERLRDFIFNRALRGNIDQIKTKDGQPYLVGTEEQIIEKILALYDERWQAGQPNKGDYLILDWLRRSWYRLFRQGGVFLAVLFLFPIFGGNLVFADTLMSSIATEPVNKAGMVWFTKSIRIVEPTVIIQGIFSHFYSDNLSGQPRLQRIIPGLDRGWIGNNTFFISGIIGQRQSTRTRFDRDIIERGSTAPVIPITRSGNDLNMVVFQNQISSYNLFAINMSECPVGIFPYTNFFTVKLCQQSSLSTAANYITPIDYFSMNKLLLINAPYLQSETSDKNCSGCNNSIRVNEASDLTQATDSLSETEIKEAVDGAIYLICFICVIACIYIFWD